MRVRALSSAIPSRSTSEMPTPIDCRASAAVAAGSPRSGAPIAASTGPAAAGSPMRPSA